MTTETTVQHTPGPWDIVFHDGRPFVIATDEDGVDWHVTEACETVWTDSETALANARLIAAAPEMLAALEAALALNYTLYDSGAFGALKGYHTGPESCYGEACECGGEQIAAAIRKARSALLSGERRLESE